MEQKLVIETDPKKFEKVVNDLIEQGWRIVPESLNTSVSNAIYNNHYICSVILEKEGQS